MWYHHILELVIEEKFEVWKIDTKVNIVDCLTKPLLDQCFGALSIDRSVNIYVSRLSRTKQNNKVRIRDNKGSDGDESEMETIQRVRGRKSTHRKTEIVLLRKVNSSICSHKASFIHNLK